MRKLLWAENSRQRGNCEWGIRNGERAGYDIMGFYAWGIVEKQK